DSHCDRRRREVLEQGFTMRVRLGRAMRAKVADRHPDLPPRAVTEAHRHLQRVAVRVEYTDFEGSRREKLEVVMMHTGSTLHESRALNVIPGSIDTSIQCHRSKAADAITAVLVTYCD